MAYFPSEVEALAVFFQYLHYAQALLAVPEARGSQLRKHLFPNVAKGGVAQIMAQRDCLCQVFVQIERPGYGPCYLGDFQSMR